MSNWRERLCGSVALRSALEGDSGQVNLEGLKSLSLGVSCGGMYVPAWQDRFAKRPSDQALPAGREILTRFIQTARKAGESFNVLAVTPGLTHVKAEEAHPEKEAPNFHATVEAVLREMGEWWHKGSKATPIK